MKPLFQVTQLNLRRLFQFLSLHPLVAAIFLILVVNAEYVEVGLFVVEPELSLAENNL